MNTKHFSYRILPLTLAVASCISAVEAREYRIADFNAQAAFSPNLQIRDRIPLEPGLSCNPPLNSVRAAHGNTDWHIDTAHEFLFGTEMDGSASAANHVPGSWSREHIHVDMTHTSDYYEDSTVVGTGEDTDSDHGIDQSMLFFYAGHGSPTSWSTLGGHGSQNDMLLGNCDNGSRLRYYWQCSCEVFAHGPDSCSGGGSFDYACPQDFDGSADSHGMRNVFERWGPALDGDLRMACGSSTSAYCHETQTNRIWDNYNNKGYDVADSFIFGLHSATGYDSHVVPLCITTGGLYTASTPLYDTTFTNVPNPSGDYYHIQYLSSFDSTAPKFMLPRIPELLPRIRLILPEPPELVRRAKMLADGYFMATPEGVEPQVRMDTRSNALLIKEAPTAQPSDAQLSKKEYIAQAQRYLREQGLHENGMGEAEVSRMMIQSTPMEGVKGSVKETQKSVLVSFPRKVEVEGIPVKVLGEGSRISVQLNNDGSPINTNKVWRKFEILNQRVPVKPMEQAYEQALKQLENADRYELARTEFGYKAESGNVSQKEMTAVYQFAFKPHDGTDETLPPRMVEIPAI